MLAMTRRAAGVEAGDDDAAGLTQAQGHGHALVHVVGGQAQPQGRHTALAHKVIHDAAGLVDRDGEADALAAGVDSGIDAHQTAFEVEQGTAAVAGVDGGVGLDQVGEHAALAADGAAQGRDHARGDGVVEAEGVADGDDGLAGHEVGGIAQGHGGQVMGALDLQHGQVEVRLRALDHGGELAAVLQMDHDLVATGDDVGVGQHQAALAVHNDAGAEAHAFLSAGPWPGRRAPPGSCAGWNPARARRQGPWPYRAGPDRPGCLRRGAGRGTGKTTDAWSTP